MDDGIQQLHEYLRTTAHITTNWYFFAGAVNAAVVTFLVSLKGLETVRQIPKLMIVFNVALAVMYGGFIPWYYWHAASSIAKYDTRPYQPFPWGLWTLTSLILAGICLATAGLWYYFFFTEAGSKRIVAAKGR